MELEFLKHSVVMVVSITKTSGASASRLPLELVSPKETISGCEVLKEFLSMREELDLPLSKYPLIPAFDGERFRPVPARLGVLTRPFML